MDGNSLAAAFIRGVTWDSLPGEVRKMVLITILITSQHREDFCETDHALPFSVMLTPPQIDRLLAGNG